MANNVESNFREKVMPSFVEEFENSRVLSKNVNTQLLDGAFDSSSGTSVAFKRAPDYVSIETADGDINASSASPIVVGNAFGRVQNQITVFIEYQAIDQALKLNQLPQLLAPAARRMNNTLELNFAKFMMKNSGLLSGTPGTSATTWAHVAGGGSTLDATGVPQDGMWNCAVNSYTQRTLAASQGNLGAGGTAGGLIKQAYQRAVIDENFAGLRVMTSNSLASYATSSVSDRAGTLSATPNVTYVTAKDTMTQSPSSDRHGCECCG